MNFEEVLNKIKKIAPKDLAANNLAEMLLYPMEEIGEVAQCISTSKGLKNKNIKEPVSVECVDVIIGMLGIYFLSGGTIEELPELIDRKSEKWKQRVEKYHVRNNWSI